MDEPIHAKRSGISVVLWNVQADQRTAERTRRIRARLEALDGDLVCLNEAFPGDVPTNPPPGHLLTSGLSDWRAEQRGARKVVLYHRAGWQDVDEVGSPLLPEGRFVAGTFDLGGRPVRVLGIAPPYHAYRAEARWGERRRRLWQGNEDYWRALGADVLPHVCLPSILLGDFNVQLPPVSYPRPGSSAHQLCQSALDRYSVATANIPPEGEALDKPLVCHVAYSPELELVDCTVFSRFDGDGLELSDHPCVLVRLRA